MAIATCIVTSYLVTYKLSWEFQSALWVTLYMTLVAIQCSYIANYPNFPMIFGKLTPLHKLSIAINCV